MKNKSSYNTTTQIKNEFRISQESIDDDGSQYGITTIEMESWMSSGEVHLSITNKGYGRSSTKSARTNIDNESIRKIIVFLEKHLQISEVYEKSSGQND